MQVCLLLLYVHSAVIYFLFLFLFGCIHGFFTLVFGWLLVFFAMLFFGPIEHAVVFDDTWYGCWRIFAIVCWVRLSFYSYGYSASFSWNTGTRLVHFCLWLPYVNIYWRSFNFLLFGDVHAFFTLLLGWYARLFFLCSSSWMVSWCTRDLDSTLFCGCMLGFVSSYDAWFGAYVVSSVFTTTMPLCCSSNRRWVFSRNPCIEALVT